MKPTDPEAFGVALHRKCESPIEQAMLLAMRKMPLYSMARRIGVFPSLDGFDAATMDEPVPTVGIIPQAQIGPYRVDFLLAARALWGIATLVVECDGFDFHNATEEQAVADKIRDRWLMDQGHRVVRFRGSEIHESAPGCAREVADRLASARGHPL